MGHFSEVLRTCHSFSFGERQACPEVGLGDSQGCHGTFLVVTARKHSVIEANLIWVWGLANRVRTAALLPARALSFPLRVSLSLVSLGERYRLAGLRARTSDSVSVAPVVKSHSA